MNRKIRLTLMYVGRLVAAGLTPSGAGVIGYRISSRSYPNRRITINGGRGDVIPTESAPAHENRFVEYSCFRIIDEFAVVTNGSHTDALAEKVAGGTPAVEAMTAILSAFGYERDGQATPRIAAVMSAQSAVAVIGIVSEYHIAVHRIPLTAGQVSVVSTNAWHLPGEEVLGLESENALGLSREIYDGNDDWAALEHPVASLAVVSSRGAWAEPSVYPQ